MDLASSITKLTSIVADLRNEYGDVIASDNDLYYSHAYEILGMLVSDNLDINKLPNPKPDMDVITQKVDQSIPMEQQLVEYVATPVDAYQASLKFWSEIQTNFKLKAHLPSGAELLLTKLVIPTFRQVIVKRCAQTIPILYAPELSVVFDDLKMLSNDKMRIEKWSHGQFELVNGHQVLQLVIDESLRGDDKLKLPHAQTIDDLKLTKRYLLPAQMSNNAQSSKRHFFDAMLSKAPGKIELDAIKNR